MQVLPRVWGRAWPYVLDRRTRRDLRLARRLWAYFEGDDVPDDGLQFFVQNGVVTVYGLVRSERARAALVQAIRAVPGVKAVTTQLQIVPPHLAARIDDAP